MVKVGHKQVVSLIRQGGNHLVMKVVSVSRKPESEEVVRKKGRWHWVRWGGGWHHLHVPMDLEATWVSQEEPGMSGCS